MVSCGNSILINHINLFSHKTAKVQVIEASEFNRRSFCAFPDLRQLTASVFPASSQHMRLHIMLCRYLHYNPLYWFSENKSSIKFWNSQSISLRCMLQWLCTLRNRYGRLLKQNLSSSSSSHTKASFASPVSCMWLAMIFACSIRLVLMLKYPLKEIDMVNHIIQE